MRKFVFLLGLLSAPAFGQTDHSAYVNPFIGTGGHGHTFPGATAPFGMVQLSPDTRIDGSWDGCSGYHYSDAAIYGFSHTHLSGTGCSDYGDIALLPLTGKKYDAFYTKKIPAIGKEEWLKSKENFSHNNETATAGYYSVKLDNGVKAEMTATTRAGFHQYTWPANAPRILVIKIDHRDKTLVSHLTVSDKKHVSGYRVSEAWAREQHIFYNMEFSEEFEIFYLEDSKPGTTGITQTALYAVLKFKKTKSPQVLKIKVGISNVDPDGARKNLEAEIPHWDFEKTKAETKAAWNKELGKIEVSSADKDKLAIFYTALYHCMVHPSTASDVDGQYRGRDNKLHQADGFTYYTVFSLWDTFRALHPLLTIIDQKRTSDIIKTFLAQYEQAKILPVWELSSNETWCMIGYHSVSVIADAYAKGIRNFNAQQALDAMQASAHFNRFSIDLFGKKLYLEKEDEHESVSKALEYAYDDWCIASFAEKMGKKEVAGDFYQRALAWRNMYDVNTGFIRPRSNGGWMEPFEPREVNNHYTEANAWQYTFFVPQDIRGMMEAQGGPQAFVKKLDALFSADSKTLGRDQSDITGLIGQYAHGNEPSHHMAYLYDYAGQPWKTQERVHQIEKEFYRNAPDGLIGNEDCGQMSAWYVFSAMGFYPVCPGNPSYALGTPVFENVKVHLENGKTFNIKAEGLSNENFYIKKPGPLSITHDRIMQGKELVLHMSATPQTDPKDYPAETWPQTSIQKNFIPVPVISAPARTFKDSMQVSMWVQAPYKIEYAALADNWIASKEPYYNKPFSVDNTINLRACAVDDKGNKSAYVYASYHKIPHDWSVKLNCTYNPQYSAGGDGGIIDGLNGDENWRKGGWQGYQGQDFECVVDLKKETDFSAIHATFLQDQRAWIIMPLKVEYACSVDGKDWAPYNTVNNTVDPKDEKVQIKDFTSTNAALKKARYIKVKATCFGKLPEWHQGYGMGDAFIFVDEISVK